MSTTTIESARVDQACVDHVNAAVDDLIARRYPTTSHMVRVHARVVNYTGDNDSQFEITADIYAIDDAGEPIDDFGPIVTVPLWSTSIPQQADRELDWAEPVETAA